MHAAEQPIDPRLLERIEELQVRVAHLEGIVLEHDEAEAVPGPHATEALVVAATETAADPRASLTHEDGPALRDTSDPLLRERQRAADGAGERSRQPQPTKTSAEEPAPGDVLIDLAYIEERLAGRALALVGGAALILGAVFFLSLAFSRGWISPDVQVAMGLLGGSVGLAIGGFLLVRGDRVVGHVLTAAGLAVISLSLFAATTLYELIDPAAGLLGILVVSAVTTLIAVAARSQVAAGFGLVAVLAAPPVLGATMDQLTLGYMIVVLAGVASVSLWQTWSWLPPLAFIISAPQLYAWVLSDPEPAFVFAALLGYWALMAISAGGEAFRRARPELSLASAPLLLAVGAFVIAMAFASYPEANQRVAFLLTLATLHALVAAWFVLRRGPVDPFGLLAAAYGVAIASLAVPLVFGASMTAAIWSAEAATLAVVAGYRAHGPSLLGALTLLGIAGTRLAVVAMEADTWRAAALQPAIGPFDTLVVGWVFFLLAGAVFVLVVPSRTVRHTVVAVAALATVPVIYRELDGVAAVTAWSALALVTLAAPRWLALLPERQLVWRLGPALEWLRPKHPLRDEAAMLPLFSAAVAGAAALATTVIATVAQDGRPEVPFSDEAGLCALVLAVACAAAGIIQGGPEHRRRGAIAAIAILGVAVVFQLPMAPSVVFWTILAAVAFGLGRADDRGVVSFANAGTALVAAAATVAVMLVPPERLVVSYGGVPPHPLLISEATMVVGAVALVLAFAAWAHAARRWSEWALAASGIALLYLLSVGIVDIFAADAHGLPWRAQDQLDQLAKEAHVALSVLWSVVGVMVTAAGLVLRRSALRIAGLAVLALATGKVFIIDLASLDIAYRVITLIVLGVLLIASAWAWTRLQPSTDAHGHA